MPEPVLIVTNNDFVRKKYDAGGNLLWIDGSALEVVKKARDAVHKGFCLITHPLAGSIKPNRTPYRTIMLKDGKVEGRSVELLSLEVIENAVMTYEKFYNQEPVAQASAQQLDDYRLIDLKLFESAIESGC